MSDSFFIAPIVEGHGEVQAVPVLLRRLAQTLPAAPGLQVNPPIRVKAGSFLNDQTYFYRFIELASQKARLHPKSCVLILLDCEDDCPARQGPDLLNRAQQVRPDIHFLVILAYREYETWFLAAARSLRGTSGLPADLEPPVNPESIRDAKGWLSRQMPTGYNEPNHQPRLTAQFSFEEGKQVPSFARAFTKITEFLNS
jgi:hypothetical protein